jgi:hypothetical protein
MNAFGPKFASSGSFTNRLINRAAPNWMAVLFEEDQ